ncbi:MAG: trypsin-like peptidase domain-containing protein [Planctomycetaceae bacterium]|jgi:serine protease Do|nr:trypsin-like peptidase domain-containing protein [Planctomycetaceae bacterium]
MQCCCAFSFGVLFADEPQPDTIKPDKITVQASELSAAFRRAAERVLPAAVKIISHVQTAEDRKAMQLQIPVLKTPPGKRNPGDSTGTGSIIDLQGIVVTNNHVIANAREIEVELPDGRHFLAKKYRYDSETDIAVIWLDVPADEKLPVIKLGDSDKMEIGDWVLAVGNPFELDSTVSAGIISAKGRSLKKAHRTEFLQTDAAINPGNSGGPLINLNGEMIGINTAIASRSGTYEGIGFALPSNNAQWIIDQLVKKGKVERAWLGVDTKQVTPPEAERLGLKRAAGLLVDYPVQGSPAAESGLKPDDVILSFDGKAVNAVYQLQRLAERAEIGKEHEIIYARGGKKYKVPVEVRPLPPSAGLLAVNQGDIAHYTDTLVGLLLAQATPPMLAKLNITGQPGMLVLAVLPGSRAEKIGLNVGTVIVQVDGQAVPTRKDYIAVREKSSLSNGIVLDVFLPGGQRQQFAVRLE